MRYDSHMDTPSELLRGRDIGLDNAGVQVDLPKLRRGRMDGAFFALYTPAEKTPDEATSYALQMLSAVGDLLERYPEQCALARTPADAAQQRKEGRFSVFLGMENASPLQESLSLLREFYRLGVRYVTLTHNGDNAWADSAAEGRTWGGLSPFGQLALAEMNRLGMVADLSHAADSTFWDCIRLSRAPIAATHSCCRALCGHRRNLSDEMLRALGEHKGYVGINFYPTFLSENAHASVQEIAGHIDHAVRLAGLDHVGIGSDYDGIEITPEGMEDVSCMDVLEQELQRRGYGAADIDKIMGDNLLAFLGRVQQASCVGQQLQP